jgi:type VI secretion system protein ImpA
MPFPENILTPIPGDNPAGVSLRYDPIYDKIKEARREDDNLNQGNWKTERKVADWAFVIKHCEAELCTRSKDLQLAAWLTEAKVKKGGFPALIESLNLITDLTDTFWDSIYPELEDDDEELRAAPLEWLSKQISWLSSQVPLCGEGYDFLKYKESRDVGLEAAATSEPAKKARAQKIKEGKLAAEDFDTAFQGTPKAFYASLESNLIKAIEAIKKLEASCDSHFKNAAPSFRGAIENAEAIKQVVKALLDKKRETEPDPIVEEAVAEEAAAEGETVETQNADGTVTETAPKGASVSLAAFSGSEPPVRKDAIEAIKTQVDLLRRLDPFNPGPYLILRGLRFGELRAAAAKGDLRQLEAPPTEIRRQLRSYAMDQKWKELLELSESAMVLPASRAWMDLQRLSVEAMVGLGEEYNAVVKAICSMVGGLVLDVPALRTVVLMDDTPACNQQTQLWIDDILIGRGKEAEGAESNDPAAKVPPRAPAPAWRKQAQDPFRLAAEALRKGDQPKAMEIMRAEVETQSSGRGRFLRQLQMAELCIQANAKDIALPFLEDIRAAVTDFKVVQWEDRALAVQALTDLYLYDPVISGNAAEKAKIFNQLCRLDPAKALSLRA